MAGWTTEINVVLETRPLQATTSSVPVTVPEKKFVSGRPSASASMLGEASVPSPPIVVRVAAVPARTGFLLPSSTRTVTGAAWLCSIEAGSTEICTVAGERSINEIGKGYAIVVPAESTALASMIAEPPTVPAR